MRTYVITMIVTTDEPLDSRDVKSAMTDYGIRTGAAIEVPFVQVALKDMS